MTPFSIADELKREKERKELKRYEKESREVWLRAWCAVAGAVNCHEVEAANRWADQCLNAFNERFKK